MSFRVFPTVLYKDLFYLLFHVYMYDCMGVPTQRPEGGTGSSGAGAMGSCDLTSMVRNVGPGN